MDGNEITTAHDHVVDKRGALTGIDNGSTVTAVGHDVAGAITQYDGRNVYHDWLGRPVLVTHTSNGNPIAAYAYDGFGRLARRTAPWQTGTGMRIEEYHYDGVRRIQEVFHDPVHGTPPWPQVPGQGGGSTPQTRTEAEYIWSAASGQPFDTCHVQIDWWDREAWFVQDHATGTVRAYTDPNGEIVEQYGFDAFGNLVRRDEFRLVKSGSQGYYNTFRQRLGHQGLFADRLEGHTNQRVLNTGIDIWYQSRSRWYAPELGRFVTADPNGTGIPVQASLAMLGKMPSGPPSGSFEWEAHYGDGWDTYTAYGANPINATDPTGLFFLFDVGGAGAIRNTLGDMQFESGMNSMQAIAMLSAGIGANQAVIAMMADSVFGAVGSRMIAYGLDLARGIRSSVWRMSPLDRGRAIEDLLGHNVPHGFKTIDIWNPSTGRAASIKSLDVTMPSYQSIPKMVDQVKSYIRKVSRFDGSQNSQLLRINPEQIRSRELILAIPPGATPEQLRALSGLNAYARERGVTFTYTEIP